MGSRAIPTISPNRPAAAAAAQRWRWRCACSRWQTARTSFGRVPADGRDAWLPSMGVGGPMARNVADLALLLSVQAGYDARAPLSMAGDGARFREPLERDFTGTRIA